MESRFARDFTNRRYLDALQDHVVLFDGATGTQLAKFPLTAADFGGKRTEGLMEMLLLHCPELVEQVHMTYFNAGAEVVKTNSFRANRLTLGEFGVSERVVELTRLAAAAARRAADRVTQESGRLRLVAGSMGPTGKLASLDDPELSDISFDELADVYAEYAQGLLEGGVDLLLIETQQDLLELRAAVYGIWRAFERLDVRVPIQAQFTLDASGHMLAGPDVETALVTLIALPVDTIGINCSTGPQEMRESVRRLLALSNRPISVMPNAGSPENVDGHAVYNMPPETFATEQHAFVDWGVRAVGGCCGTGPEHIAALRQMLSEVESDAVVVQSGALPYVASNMAAVNLHQEPRPLIVGERINTQGSRKARRLVLNEQYDALLALAETQVDYGAHVLDVCVALTERDDEPETMSRVVKLLTMNSPAPLMIDSTNLEVMRAALKVAPGRALLNSVNLEAGEEHAREVLSLAREFGAALIALTIDEEGMAKTAARKLAIAKRLYKLAVDEIGLPPHALIFDPLTFTLATGDVESANSAVETLEAIKQIKSEMPGVLTNLGVSNVSYGLKAAARRVLNSVFLRRAVEAGLDVAIVNPAQITPYPDIEVEARDLAEALVFNRDPEALTHYITHFEGLVEEVESAVLDSAPVSERLFQAVSKRRREGVEALVDACLLDREPLAVLNEILLPAMKEVGERFGSGELILPFVLKSAEVMKVAVEHLEQHLDHSDDAKKGVVVLATVFGDVHDIGKNLVKTILANNGYAVHDLGKQVPVDVVIDKAIEVGADAIGLSALLVATSQQMQRTVEELQRRDLDIPLLIGGAAINPAFAQRIAMPVGGELYRGGVYYCKDAFEALQVLEHIVMYDPPPPPEHHHHHDEPVLSPVSACSSCADSCGVPDVSELIPVPQAPFWGSRVVRGIALEDLLPLLDRKSLFRAGWGGKATKGEAWDAMEKEFTERLTAMWAQASAYLKPRAAYGYFPAQSDGDDLLIYDPAEPVARREIARFHFPRQSMSRRRADGRCLCLADYFAPLGSNVLDVLALQAVTVGDGAATRFGTLDAAGDYSEAYFVHGLAAHITEAAATWMHRRIRRELGIAEDQGRRYSWGYPACPDLGGHRTLFELLPLADALELSLSSAGQLIPEYSTAALVAHHPDAVYFVV